MQLLTAGIQRDTKSGTRESPTEGQWSSLVLLLASPHPSSDKISRQQDSSLSLSHTHLGGPGGERNLTSTFPHRRSSLALKAQALNSVPNNFVRGRKEKENYRTLQHPFFRGDFNSTC